MKITQRALGSFLGLIALAGCTGLGCPLTPASLPSPTLTAPPTPTSAFYADTGTWPAAPAQDDYLVGILAQSNPASFRRDGQSVFAVGPAFRAQRPGLPGLPELLTIGQVTSPAVLLTNGHRYPVGYAKFVEHWPRYANMTTLMLPVDPAGSYGAVRDATGAVLLLPVSGNDVYAQIAGIQFWISDPNRMFFAPVS
jgi:hypothetical protein